MRQVLTDGAIAGFELQDVRVSVYDGKHHAVDSKEVAFVAAGKKAFIDRDQGSGPDRARADRARRDQHAVGRDRRRDQRPRRRGAHASADRTRCPAARRRSRRWCRSRSCRTTCRGSRRITGGEGTYTMDLSHYDPVPARKQQELVAAFKPQEEAE